MKGVEGGSTRREGESWKYSVVCHLGKVPCDRYNSRRLVGDLCEGTRAQVDAVLVIACRTFVRDSDGDGLAIVGVRDRDLLSTERTVVVAGRVDGGDEVGVGVNSAAGTSDAVLVEEGSVSAGISPAGAGRLGSSGRRGRSLLLSCEVGA